MFIPPIIVKMVHEQQLKELGFIEADQESKVVAELQELMWQTNEPQKKKRRHRVFGTMQIIQLFRKCKAFVRQWFQREHFSKRYALPRLSSDHSKINHCDIQEEHGYC